MDRLRRWWNGRVWWQKGLVILGLVAILAVPLITGGDDETGSPPRTETATPTPTTPPPPAAPQTVPPPTVDVVETTAAPTPPTTAAPTDPRAGPPPGSEPVFVVEVADGDSFVVQFGSGGNTEPVRLIGINSPEHDECFGEEAAAAAEALLIGAVVAMTSDVTDRDELDRLLRYLWLEDGTLVNEVLVADGYAIAREFPPNVAYTAQLDAAEARARQARRGLWSRDACGPASAAAVVISGVNFDAPGDDNQALNEEWVLVDNPGTVDADLGGWVLRDESSTHRYTFPDGYVLAAGAQLQVFSGCGTDTAAALYWCRDGAVWNNDGDTAYLLDPNGNFVDIWEYSEDTPSP